MPFAKKLLILCQRIIVSLKISKNYENRRFSRKDNRIRYWGKNGKQSFRVIKVNFQKPYRNYKWLLDCLETNTGTCFQTDEELQAYIGGYVLADKTTVTIT